MRSSHSWRKVLAVLETTGFCVAVSAGSALAASGDIYNLGVLPNQSDSHGTAINESGQVTGTSGGIACRYDGAPGSGTMLGLVPEPSSATWKNPPQSQGQALNNAGQVTGGGLLIHGDTGVFLYTGTPGNGGTFTQPTNISNYSIGNGINNSGQIVGDLYFEASLPHYQAFLYNSTGSNQGVHTLIAPTVNTDEHGFKYATATRANGVNDAGQVTGAIWMESEADGSSDSQAHHAYLFTGAPGSGSPADLGTLGGRDSEGNAVNSSGTVVGWSDTDGGDRHAFVYENGTMRDLGTLDGMNASTAWDINDAGFIVGESADTQTEVDPAVLWTPSLQLIDLNAWLAKVNPVAASHWSLLDAKGINNSGLITGTGLFDGRSRAYILDASGLVSPAAAVSLPPAVYAGLAMMGGLLGIQMVRRRRTVGAAAKAAPSAA